MRFFLTLISVFIYNAILACTCPNINNITTTCCINTPGTYNNVTISSGGLLRIEVAGVIINNLTFNSGAITINPNSSLQINNTGNINLNGNTRFNVLGDLVINAGIIMQNGNNTTYIEQNGSVVINGNVVINTPSFAVNGFILCGDLEINGNLTFNTGGSINFCNSTNTVMRVNNLISGNGTFSTGLNTCHNLYITGNGQFNNTSVNFNSGIRVCVDGNITGSSANSIIENCDNCGVLNIKKSVFEFEKKRNNILIRNTFIKLNAIDEHISYSIYDIIGKEVKRGLVNKQTELKIYYEDFSMKGLYMILVNNLAYVVMVGWCY